jgi:hypothetical protein
VLSSINPTNGSILFDNKHVRLNCTFRIIGKSRGNKINFIGNATFYSVEAQTRNLNSLLICYLKDKSNMWKPTSNCCKLLKLPEDSITSIISLQSYAINHKECYKTPVMTMSREVSDPLWVYCRQPYLALARDWFHNLNLWY